MKNEKIIWDKDGSEMVLIPAGSFEMGDHFSEGDDDELPIHEIELDAFYMDACQVTVRQFKQFVEQDRYSYNDWNDVAEYLPADNYPMRVSWDDAAAYAKWAGKRLPTEAEWEYAARGGLAGKRYPWGDHVSHDDANSFGTGGKDKWSGCAPVGSFEANGYGLYDMAGNLHEWCQDWFGKEYYSNSPSKNPPGPDTGSYFPSPIRMLRGEGWGSGFDSTTNGLRVASRDCGEPDVRCGTTGFRCVADLP